MKKQLTPEEIKVRVEARARRDAEYKAEQERLQLYGAALEKMSDQGLRAELRRAIRRERIKVEGKMAYNPGLTIAFATVLATVFENTKTPTNPNGKVRSYPV